MTRKSESTILKLLLLHAMPMSKQFFYVHRIKEQELEINQLKAENEMLRKQARLPSGVPQLPVKGMNVRAVSGRKHVQLFLF